MPEISTSDLILNAAMELFSQKGYAAVTTKEIAAKAQVNEVTLFRHFETKQQLFNKVFSKYIFEPSFEDVFHKQIVCDLSKDLLNIALFFQDIIIKNSKLLQMNMRDGNKLIEDDFAKRFLYKAKQELISYFLKMKEKGFITEEPEILATNFLIIIIGMLISLFYEGFEIEQGIEVYWDKMVDIFVKGINVQKFSVTY